MDRGHKSKIWPRVVESDTRSEGLAMNAAQSTEYWAISPKP